MRKLVTLRAACQKPSSDVTRLNSQGQLCSVLQALRGSPVPHSFRLLVEFNSFQVPIPLMAVSWGPFPASGSCLDCLGHGPTAPSKTPAVVRGVPLTVLIPPAPFSLHFIPLNCLFCFPLKKKILATPCGRWDLSCLTRDGGKSSLFIFKNSGGYTGTTWIIQGNFPILR